MIPNSIRDFKSVATYLDRIGGEPKGLFTATVKETVGSYWRELCNIRFAKNGEVKCTSPAFEPTEDEKALLKAEFASAEWPKCVYPTNLENLPKKLAEADPEDLYIFWDIDHKHIIMIQHRYMTEKGKVYVPWSFWDDGQWRACEPETESGLLPLYGLHTLKGNTTAFINEGSKSSRAVERVINPKNEAEREFSRNFPWQKQFQYAGSVGFCGGALAPHRTDWGALKKAGIQRVIIIADNDRPGTDAVPIIADLVDMPAFVIQFDETWPTSFDMADEWPSHLFRFIDGKKYYIGPSYYDVIRPATFMTKQIVVADDKGKDKTVAVLRHHAKSQWFYAEKQHRFVNSEFPNIEVAKDGIDELLGNFSHTPAISKLLLKEYSSRVWKLAYRPDIAGRRVLVDGEMAINLFRGTNINPQEGDPKPFLDFLEYLIPDPKECHQAKRWIATIIAKPEIRILYGMLLISTQTGIGKTLLCESIIAPLIGMNNVSFPAESTVMEIYTSWIAKKRLAIIGEVYQGHSFKMANKLKQYITDTKVTYREMYETPITMDNFCHFIACSNSMAALKMDSEERRWFVPTLNETRLNDEQYDKLFDWLHSGGLSIVYHWAENFNDYIRRSEKAPMTQRKEEIIESSRSKASSRAEELARAMDAFKEPIAVGDKDVLAWIEAVSNEKIYDSLLDIRKQMRKNGATEAKELGLDRLSLSAQMQNVMLSKSAVDKLKEIADIGQRKEILRGWVKRPSEIMIQD